MEETTHSRFRFDSLTFFVGFGLGSFIGVALALLAITMVQRADTPEPERLGFVLSTLPPTPLGATSTPDNRPRTKTALDVRVGPGQAFAVVGTLPREEPVEVVGRDASSGWVAIRFPAGSPGRGWLPVAELDGVSGLDLLTVALPTPLPRNVTVPPDAFAGSGGSGLGGAGRSDPGPDVPAGTPTPAFNAGPPDLVLNRVSVLADGRVLVVVGNIGPGDLIGQQINVSVRDLAFGSELLLSPQRGLAVGETVTLTTTSFIVRGELEVVALADPNSNINDRDRSNNVLRVVLSRPVGPSPSPTPRGSGGGD